LLELGDGELRWCASTEVDGANGFSGGATRGLLAKGIDIALTELQARRRIEAAIDASACTEWDMNIDSCHNECKNTNFV
jgi:hypothetical protein